MFDQDRHRLGGRLGRRGQGILNLVMGVLFVLPESYPDGTMSKWRIAVGGAFVLLGAYGILTASRSKNEPL